MAHLILYHIPISPFRQRPDILRTLRGQRDEAGFRAIDIVRPQLDRRTALAAEEQMRQPCDRCRIRIVNIQAVSKANSPRRRAEPYELEIRFLGTNVPLRGNPTFFKLKGEY